MASGRLEKACFESLVPECSGVTREAALGQRMDEMAGRVPDSHGRDASGTRRTSQLTAEPAPNSSLRVPNRPKRLCRFALTLPVAVESPLRERLA